MGKGKFSVRGFGTLERRKRRKFGTRKGEDKRFERDRGERQTFGAGQGETKSGS